MKPGACLLNASRGTVVVIAALAEALAQRAPRRRRDRRLPRGAGVQQRRLQHAAARPAQRDPHAAHRRLDGGSAGGDRPRGRDRRSPSSSTRGATTGAVNFPQRRAAGERGHAPHPERAPQRARRAPRHQQDRLATSTPTSARQLLATDADIGYLIMDLDQDVSQDVKTAVAALDDSIKTRILF